jgi:DegV family protein with EDD domain
MESDKMSVNQNFVFATDSTSDLPVEIYKNNNIKLIELTYQLDGKEYADISGMPYQEFYNKLRQGASAKTSQVTPDTFESIFTDIVKEGKGVLYVAFSSGLSGTYNSARIAAETVKEKYPDAKIRIVDSLSASLGEGLLVYKAIEVMNQGKSLDEVADWVEEHKLHLCHMFTVDDLMFLHRGGRVSKTSAIAGSILGIKPGLHVDNEGHLIPLAKIRGRKQSINWLVENMEKRIGNWKNDVFAICHGDCIEDAKYLQSLVKEKFGIEKCIIRNTGTVIGSHSGPGTLALFFLGDYR